MDGDGSNKKLRKPYTITKSRDRWSEEEHERFLEGLLLFGREWKKIEDFVGTKTVIQSYGPRRSQMFEKSQTIYLHTSFSICLHFTKEIVSFYKRFCQLDRNMNGPILTDEYLSILEFTLNPLSQIRSHAQKYFLKVQKNGLMTHVPPPRPKRNHAYPYPQKSSDGMLALQASIVCPTPSSCFIPSCTSWDDSSWDDSSMLMGYTTSNDSMSSDYATALTGVEGDHGSMITRMYNQKFSWSAGSSRSWPIHIVPEQGTQPSHHPVIPNFAEVYNLIATLIDPDTTNSFAIYMQKLKEMDPITAKTALVLVKNLTINLSSPDFKPLSRWLLTCDAGTKTMGETSDAATTAAVGNQMYSMPSQCAGYLPMP